MYHLHWVQQPKRRSEPAPPADLILAARRCTLQLSNGYLYLDAVANPATALLGHDEPPAVVADALRVTSLLNALVAPYCCVALTAAANAAAELAREIAVRLPAVKIVDERAVAEHRGWLPAHPSDPASDMIVLGETLSAGASFGALLAREHLADGVETIARRMKIVSPSAETLNRVAGVIQWINDERLIENGPFLMSYVRERLESLKANARQISSIEYTALSARLAFVPPTDAVTIKRKMCERGVLVGTDTGRLVITPSLALRLAEVDVITGTLRAALSDTPTWRMPVCCPACEAGFER
jgi:4-aminobutyrate aminotransferase-like enzyme